jgi:hypothetical protein
LVGYVISSGDGQKIRWDGYDCVSLMAERKISAGKRAITK